MWKLTSSVPHNGPSLFSSAYGPVSILFLCCAELVVASLPCQLPKYPLSPRLAQTPPCPSMGPRLTVVFLLLFFSPGFLCQKSKVGRLCSDCSGKKN